jgi:hypothetical protein
MKERAKERKLEEEEEHKKKENLRKNKLANDVNTLDICTDEHNPNELCHAPVAGHSQVVDKRKETEHQRLVVLGRQANRAPASSHTKEVEGTRSKSTLCPQSALASQKPLEMPWAKKKLHHSDPQPKTNRSIANNTTTQFLNERMCERMKVEEEEEHKKKEVFSEITKDLMTDITLPRVPTTRIRENASFFLWLLRVSHHCVDDCQ